MKKYFNRERVLWIITICFFVLCLTSCSSGDSYQKPLDLYKNENFFGWILVWPIGWVMSTIGKIFPAGIGFGQFGWGLLFTTIIVRTIAWPIYAKSNDMSLKMSVMQPEMQRLQTKYANRKDPMSQQRMQQEMLALYKKHGVNPLGIFTPFLQMPIFMAMYTVVRRIVVLKEDGTPGLLTLIDDTFFGLENCLSQGVYGSTNPATLWSANFWVGIILAVLVGVTMWLLNFIAQRKPAYAKKNPNPQQQENTMAKQMKFMNWFMIAMMVMAALGNNGLALYWVFGNLYSLVQNLINRKINEKKYYKMRNEIDVLISK